MINPLSRNNHLDKKHTRKNKPTNTKNIIPEENIITTGGEYVLDFSKVSFILIVKLETNYGDTIYLQNSHTAGYLPNPQKIIFNPFWDFGIIDNAYISNDLFLDSNKLKRIHNLSSGSVLLQQDESSLLESSTNGTVTNNIEIVLDKFFNKDNNTPFTFNGETNTIFNSGWNSNNWKLSFYDGSDKDKIAYSRLPYDILRKTINPPQPEPDPIVPPTYHIIQQNSNLDESDVDAVISAAISVDTSIDDKINSDPIAAIKRGGGNTILAYEITVNLNLYKGSFIPDNMKQTLQCYYNYDNAKRTFAKLFGQSYQSSPTPTVPDPVA